MKLRDICWTHTTEGGTFITNFSAGDAIEEAVLEYNEPRLVVSEKVSPAGRALGGKSLHWIGRERLRTLTGFWMMVRCIEAERLPAGKETKP